MKAVSVRTCRSVIMLVAGSAILASQAGVAQAGLTLTGALSGATLSTYAFGFPNDLGTGPVGVVTTGAGRVLVTDDNGQVFLLPDIDGTAAGIPVTDYGQNNATGLASFPNGKAFLANWSAGQVIEVDPTTGLQVAGGVDVPILEPIGIVAYPQPPMVDDSDPLIGRLFVSSYNGIYVVDATSAPGTVAVWMSMPGVDLDGIAISPDGTTLYVAAKTSNAIMAFSTDSKELIWTSPAIPGGPDGIALGTGCLTGFVYVNTNGGDLWQMGLPGTPNANVATKVATGGSRGDFVAVDPGLPSGFASSLLITQTDRILRLSVPNAGWFGASSSSQLPPGQSGLSLTGAAMNRGFLLTTFATGFASSGAGPLGIAFRGDGGVLVTDHVNGSLYTLPTDADGQVATLAAVQPYSGMDDAAGLSQDGTRAGSFYMTQKTSGGVVRISQDGTSPQLVAAIAGATGIVFHPGTGLGTGTERLYVSAGSTIYEVNPATNSQSAIVSVPGTVFDGLAISPDLQTLYAAEKLSSTIYGYTLPINGGAPWISPTLLGGVDGLAIGLGTLEGFIYGNLNSGDVYEVGLPLTPHAGESRRIAAGGSRGDFIAVDPNILGCGPPSFPTLLLTQANLIKRLDPLGGGWFGPPYPRANLVGVDSKAPGAAFSITPNPGRTAVATFELPAGAQVDLSVFDLAGRRVARLASGWLPRGRYTRTWSGAHDLGEPSSSGVYFYRLMVGATSRTLRAVIVK